MKKLFLLTIALLSCFTAFSAETDAEVQRLQSIVTSLRKGGEKAFKKAVAQMAADKLWTPMDELPIARHAECRISDGVAGFRLNAIMTNAENAQRYQTTTGLYLNGTDTRYNYSLTEKTIKPGKSVNYGLTGRWGPQTFIVMPFGGEKARLKISVKCGPRTFSASNLADGAVCLTGIALKDSPVIIQVENPTAEPVSYVIINHNSRK